MIASHSFWPLCMKSQLKLTCTQGHLINVIAPSYEVTEWSSRKLCAGTIWTQEWALGSSTDYTFSSSKDVIKAAQQWDIVPGNIFIGINKVTNSFVTKMYLR